MGDFYFNGGKEGLPPGEKIGAGKTSTVYKYDTISQESRVLKGYHNSSLSREEMQLEAEEWNRVMGDTYNGEYEEKYASAQVTSIADKNYLDVPFVKGVPYKGELAHNQGHLIKNVA